MSRGWRKKSWDAIGISSQGGVEVRVPIHPQQSDPRASPHLNPEVLMEPSPSPRRSRVRSRGDGGGRRTFGELREGMFSIPVGLFLVLLLLPQSLWKLHVLSAVWKHDEFASADTLSRQPGSWHGCCWCYLG